MLAASLCNHWIFFILLKNASASSEGMARPAGFRPNCWRLVISSEEMLIFCWRNHEARSALPKLMLPASSFLQKKSTASSSAQQKCWLVTWEMMRHACSVPPMSALLFHLPKMFFYGEIMRHPGVVPTNSEGLIIAIVEHQMIKYFYIFFQQKYWGSS